MKLLIIVIILFIFINLNKFITTEGRVYIPFKYLCSIAISVNIKVYAMVAYEQQTYLKELIRSGIQKG